MAGDNKLSDMELMEQGGLYAYSPAIVAGSIDPTETAALKDFYDVNKSNSLWNIILAIKTSSEGKNLTQEELEAQAKAEFNVIHRGHDLTEAILDEFVKFTVISVLLSLAKTRHERSLLAADSDKSDQKLRTLLGFADLDSSEPRAQDSREGRAYEHKEHDAQPIPIHVAQPGHLPRPHDTVRGGGARRRHSKKKTKKKSHKKKSKTHRKKHHKKTHRKY